MPPLKMDVLRDYVQSSKDDRLAIGRILVQTMAFISPALFISNALLESGVIYYQIPARAIIVATVLVLIVNRAMYRIHSSDPDAHDESLYQKTHRKFGLPGVYFLRTAGFIYYQSYTAAMISIIALTTVNASPGEDVGLFISLIFTLYLTVYSLSRLSPESFQKVCTFVAGASLLIITPLLIVVWVLKTSGIVIQDLDVVPLDHSFNAEIAQVILATMGFEWMWRTNKPHTQHEARLIYTGSSLAILASCGFYMMSVAVLFSQKLVLSMPPLVFHTAVALTLPVGVLSAGCAFIKSGDLLDKDIDNLRYLELLLMATLTLFAALFIKFLPILGGIAILSAMLFFFIIALSDRQDFISWFGAIFLIVVAIFCMWDLNHIIIIY